MATKKNTEKDVIELGAIKDVQHNAEHLREALKISDERAHIIADVIELITKTNGLKISEVLCKTAEQLKGNELVYGLFILGKFHGNVRQRQSAPIAVPGTTMSPADFQRVIEQFLAERDKDKPK